MKYILSIIDAFSLKGMIYGHNSKDSDNILNDIIEYCLNNGFPKEFLCDNGPEFCIKNYIKYMHGISNNPHSHGTIERFNYTVKKYLAKEFIFNNRIIGNSMYIFFIIFNTKFIEFQIII